MDGIRSGQHSSLNADYIYVRVVLSRWHRIRLSPRRRCYIHTLDVFRLEKSGSFLWIGSAKEFPDCMRSSRRQSSRITSNEPLRGACEKDAPHFLMRLGCERAC